MSLSKELADMIRKADDKQTSPYDTQAIVTRVEDDTIWVHIPGGVDETPIQRTISAQAGDTVMVRVSGGRAWIVGNKTAPPTDDTQAVIAREEAAEAATKATSYITDITDEGIMVHPSDSTETGVKVTDKVDIIRGGESVAEFGESARIGRAGEARLNLTYNSMQMIDRYGESCFFVSDFQNADGSVTFWCYVPLLISAYTAEVSPIMDLSKAITVVVDGEEQTSGFTVDDESHITFTSVFSEKEVAIIYYPDEVTYYYTKAFTLGKRARAESIGFGSYAEGYEVVASGYLSHAEGSGTTADGSASHAEGAGSGAYGEYAHAEGRETVAGNPERLSIYSIGAHAEGQHSHADGAGAHAEGLHTTARGGGAHAEGNGATASNSASHAEGMDTVASGYCSHASGYKCVATESYQTVVGKFNAATRSGSGTDADPYEYTDAGDYAFIVGNGTGDATEERSNALTVDWDGNTVIGGALKVEGHSTAIGYRNAANGTKSVSTGSASNTKLTDTAVSISAGTWLLIGSAEFPANATGVRHLAWADGTTVLQNSRMTVPASSGGLATRLQVTATVSADSAKSMNLYAFQTSGSAQTVSWYWQIVRIA